MLIALAAKKSIDISFLSATDLLTSYHYDYTTNSRCDFHEDIGTHYCALGFVKRYCYMISDHLCIPFNITPIREKHLPVEQVTSMSVRADNPDFRSVSKRMKGSMAGSRSVLNDNRSDYDPSGSFTDIRYKNRNDNESTMSTITSLRNESSVMRAATFSEAASSHPRQKVADMLMSKIPGAGQARSVISTTTTSYAPSSEQVETVKSRFRFENFDDSASVTERSEHGFLHENRDEDDEKMTSTIDADDDDDDYQIKSSSIRVPQRSKTGRAAYNRAAGDYDTRSGISSLSSTSLMRGRGFSRR